MDVYLHAAGNSHFNAVVHGGAAAQIEICSSMGDRGVSWN
jgi:hypothetical protein